jgi:hypothetical protein
MIRLSPDQIRAKVCGDKLRYAWPSQARRAARMLERQHGGRFAGYRCPFSDDRHWHVGHVPSMASLESIARVIRGLDTADPQPHDPPARLRRRVRR